MFCERFIGMRFGVVSRLYWQGSAQYGSIYAYDVLGSSIGALIVCSLLLPLLGMQEMILFLSLVFVPAIAAA
jgi:hypothetical protein